MDTFCQKIRTWSSPLEIDLKKKNLAILSWHDMYPPSKRKRKRTDVRTFAANFPNHDAAVQYAELNGWTLQTTEPMERGVWARFTE